MRVRSARRRGGAALVALACLGVIVLVMAGLLRVAASRAGQIRAIERGAQAAWLVEAGLERAAARLAADASYAGESWSIPAELLGGRPATVVIEVDPEAGAGGVREVRVRADYPGDGDPGGRARRSKVFQVRPGAGMGGDEG